MILTRLHDYLQLHGRANVPDLAHHLQASPTAVQGMLEALERKGVVRRTDMTDGCGGCTKCSPGSAHFYEWVADRQS